jgi:hypothetical protein
VRPCVVHVAMVQPAAMLACLSTSEVQSQALTGYCHFTTEPESHAFVAAR